ncbi:MAG: hypothetical protein JXA11_05310 [Phycisphaerae bacterium]|nr:hypothetical protein [Phycisphaerae bacterium]
MSQGNRFHRRVFEHPVAWIAPEGVSKQTNCHFRVRRVFDHDEIRGEKLFIAAESFYALYVNGRLVGVGPARGTYQCNFIDEHDISSCLQPGRNVIAAEVFCNNFPTFISSPAEPAVFIRVGRFATDESWQAQIAPDWRVEDLPTFTLQIGKIEWRDLRREPVGWATGTDEDRWQNAVLLPPDRPIHAKTLYHRDVASPAVTKIPPVKFPVVRAIERLTDADDSRVAELMTDQPLYDPADPISLDPLALDEPVDIPPQPDGRGVLIVADFTRAFIGGIEVDVEAPEGAILDVGYEEIIEEGRLTPARNHYRMADRYILREGRQTITNPLHWRGGRYLQLVPRNFRRPVRIHRLRAVDRRYPLRRTAEFSCDDESLNELWRRCGATLSACATDTFLDCPWREMSFWVNDFVVQNEFWWQLIGPSCGDLVRRSLSLALSQPNAEGLAPGVCPSDGRDGLVLFPTNLFLAMILRDYQTYTGDRQYVDAVLPAVENIFQICRRHADEDGLLTPPKQYWNFTDWSYWMAWQKDPYPLDRRNTCIVNWFQVHAAAALARLYQGRDAHKADLYDKIARDLAEAVVRKFWDEPRKVFREFLDDARPASQITHALALLSERLPEKLVSPCRRALTRDDCLTPELYMMHYVLRALAQTGRGAAAMERIRRFWGSQLSFDCPTIWEANVYEYGKDAYDLSGSLCHAFSLAPVTFFQQTILGAAPLADGYARFRIAPTPCGLSSARGTVPTPHGWISVAWKTEGQTVTLSLDVPAGTTAVLTDGRELSAGKHDLQLSATETYQSHSSVNSTTLWSKP